MKCEECPFGSPEGCTFYDWLWRHQSDATAPCREEEEEDGCTRMIV